MCDNLQSTEVVRPLTLHTLSPTGTDSVQVFTETLVHYCMSALPTSHAFVHYCMSALPTSHASHSV